MLARLAALLLFMVMGLLDSAAFANGAKQQASYVGVRTLGVWDAPSGTRLEIAVWYPTTRSGETSIGEWKLNASRNAREMPWRFPVILVSHDIAGNRFSNHDLAEALAERGFVVIAPTHQGSNAMDASDLYSINLFINRPRQLILALEAAMDSYELNAVIDASRIGLLGVGSGSATVLQLAGVGPDSAGYEDYCAKAPSGDPFCSAWARKSFAGVRQKLQSLGSALTPDINATPHPAANQAPPAKANAARTAAGASNSTQPAPRPEHPGAAHGRESRSIKAVGLLTPGLGMFFNAQNLAGLKMPLAVLSAGQDELYPEALNAGRIERGLPPGTTLDVLSIPGADHFSLQAPCPEEMRQSLPELCGRASQSKRLRWAEERNHYFVRFYQTALGGPLPQIHDHPPVPEELRPPVPQPQAAPEKEEEKNTEEKKAGAKEQKPPPSKKSKKKTSARQ